MIFLPKFLYSFRAAPVFLTKNLFQTIDFSLSAFFWNGTQLRIAGSPLQVPKADGGLACPNLHNYLIASQLTYVWLVTFYPLHCSFLLFFFASLLTTSELHRSVGSRFFRYSPVHVGFLAWQEWGQILLQSSQGVSSQVPLWNNPNLPELCGHSDSTWWGRKIFVPSETLKGSHGVDNTLCFKYLLFRNAIQTQFGTLTLGLTEPPMEDLLSYPVLN